MSIRYFSIPVLTSAELSRFSHIDYKSLMARTSWLQARQSAPTSGVFEDLYKIYLKNDKFSFRQLLIKRGFESQ